MPGPTYWPLFSASGSEGSSASSVICREEHAHLVHDDGRVEEVQEIVRDVDFLEVARDHQRAQAQVNLQPHHVEVLNRDRQGRRIEPRLSDCGCLEVPATPATLPWLVPQAPGLNPATVAAVGIVHKSHTTERMLQMAPYLEGRCQAYGTTPAEVAMTLMALHNIHVGGSRLPHITTALRNKALSVALAMYGTTGVMEPQTAIDKARRQPWTRTIEFSADLTLTALAGTAITGTAAAATYLAGAWVGAKAAEYKIAGTVGTKASAGVGLIAGGVGTAILGLGTSVAAIGTVAWCYNIVEAYRDVWDNEFSRDAFFCHKMRDHHVLPEDDHYIHCHHANNGWSSINNQLRVGHRGIRWN